MKDGRKEGRKLKLYKRITKKMRAALEKRYRILQLVFCSSRFPGR